jgi:hypothetical protein
MDKAMPIHRVASNIPTVPLLATKLQYPTASGSEKLKEMLAKK